MIIDTYQRMRAEWASWAGTSQLVNWWYCVANSDSSYDLVGWHIWRGISRLLGTRVHPRLGWISQYYNMPLLYDSNWTWSSQCTEWNYIIPGPVMGFWKLLSSLWYLKNCCRRCRWIFLKFSSRISKRPYWYQYMQFKGSTIRQL